MASLEHEIHLSSSLTHPREPLGDGPPSLARLVHHFVASKRSLSSATHVWRANEIVTTSKAILETIATLNAQSNFLRRHMYSQVSSLQAIKHGLALVEKRINTQFKAVLRSLDEADIRIKRTVELLKTTIIEPSMRPEDETPKSLLEFIDENNVDELTQAFRSSIDNATDARADYAEAYEAFATELQQLESMLSTFSETAASTDLPQTAATFHALESNATEMATSLSSLVQHYDLCITALKHTEGGGEAAEQAEVDLPPGVDVGTLDRNAPLQPISEEERSEMMNVLEKDANEVEDVVSEISERAIEMEAQLAAITIHVKAVERDNLSTSDAAQVLRRIGTQMPIFVEASNGYTSRWTGVKQRIDENLEELEGVLDVYANFLRGYDGLLVEIDRRMDMQLEMEKIAHNAMKKIDKLHHEDASNRKTFMLEHGEFLPADIWTDLLKEPQRFKVGTDEEQQIVFPTIPAATLQGAKTRTSNNLH